jgi:plasmid maintenance system antidote protein VapI
LILSAMRRAGLTRAETARLVGCPPTSISNVVYGRSGFTADFALRLARALQVGPGVLLEGLARRRLARARDLEGKRLRTLARRLARNPAARASPGDVLALCQRDWRKVCGQCRRWDCPHCSNPDRPSPSRWVASTATPSPELKGAPREFDGLLLLEDMREQRLGESPEARRLAADVMLTGKGGDR